MSTIKVIDRYIDVDVVEEISEYDWHNAKWSEDKLIASSPFRYGDSSPSFWVNLTGEYAGVFGDSAYDDDYYRAGGLVKLLAFLRDESFEETADYLLDKYDYDYTDNDIELITPKMTEKRRKVILPDSMTDKPMDTTYLIGRGIHPKVIEMNRVFDNGDSVGIPWRDMSGNVCAIKYRHKRSKYFWYERGATPLADLVYGLDIVVQRGITRAVICEAEIDAMSWQSAGIFAIAIGGARINARQADMIVQSGLTEIVIAGDNDEQGRKFNRKVEVALSGKITLYSVDYTQFGYCKDANELGKMELRNITTNEIRKEIRI